KTGLPLAGVVVSYGNTSLSNATDNTARILSFAGNESVPVLAGLSAPCRKHKFCESVIQKRQETSGNGLCNLTFPPSGRAKIEPTAPAIIAQKLKELAQTHGPLDYFIIGPSSNFAAIAEALGSELKTVIARITMLGGKFDPLWAEMPSADFNIACDPYALKSILGLGLPMRFVPLNATWPIAMPLPEIEKLVPGTTLAQKAQDLMIAHCRNFASEPIFRFHDPSILMAAQSPEGFEPRTLDVVCDESSDDFGRLVETENGIPCEIYQTDEGSQSRFKKGILSALGFNQDI
ncbi:MAG: nucleoside hydrolase, partial [Alphaproteobacteria bacterium]|nr:nucleoside hydrolase [Alphaproteobacteria bacterium]